MKIGIVGDTHGDKRAIDKMIAKTADVRFYLHTGDLLEDARYLENKTGKIVYGVCGNCDSPCFGMLERLISIDGKKILLTHGHKYGVKHTLNNLYYRAAELSADAVIFGHTHMAMSADESGISIFNPGSIHSPRGGIYRTFGILDIDGGSMMFSHMTI